jgi:hypothetical protein
MTEMHLTLDQKLVSQFEKYWSRLVNQGTVSPMDRLEWMAIEIFAEWLTKEGQPMLKKELRKE